MRLNYFRYLILMVAISLIFQIPGVLFAQQAGPGAGPGPGGVVASAPPSSRVAASIFSFFGFTFDSSPASWGETGHPVFRLAKADRLAELAKADRQADQRRRAAHAAMRWRSRHRGTVTP